MNIICLNIMEFLDYNSYKLSIHMWISFATATNDNIVQLTYFVIS